MTMFASPAKTALLLGLAVAVSVAGPPARADITGVGGVLEPSRSLSGSYLAGRLAEQLNDKTSAAEFFREALRRDPENPEMLDRTFSLELVAGNIEEAHDLAVRLVEIDPSHRLARMTLGIEAFRARQFAEARRHFEDTARSPISDLTGALLVAWSQVGTGDIDDALATVAAIDGSGSADIERFKTYHSALINDVGGRTDEARRLMALVHEENSGDGRAIQMLARYAMLDGDMDRARELVAAMPANVARHPVAQMVTESVEQGVAPLPVAANAREGAVEALFGIGSAISRGPTDDNAVLFHQLALALVPDAAMPLILVGEHFDAVSDYAAAAAAYDRVPETSPLRADADLRRARSLSDLDRFEEARDLLLRLEDAEPGDREIAFTLATLLHERERFGEASIHYSRAIEATDEITEADWFLFYYRGITYERTDRWPQAEADLKRALELNPDHPYVLNYLGYSWIDQGINLDEALALVERAVELQPRDGDITDSLGWAYYRLGRYEEAVEVLERAVELRADEPVIHDHLGDAYWKVGRRLEARFQWQHALDLDPDDELAETIRDKLDNGLGDVADVQPVSENGG